jgi:hypothetical protein
MRRQTGGVNQTDGQNDKCQLEVKEKLDHTRNFSTMASRV